MTNKYPLCGVLKYLYELFLCYLKTLIKHTKYTSIYFATILIFNSFKFMRSYISAKKITIAIEKIQTELSCLTDVVTKKRIHANVVLVPLTESLGLPPKNTVKCL